MALDRNDSHISSPDGGKVILPMHAMLDAFIIDEIRRQERERQNDTRQRIGLEIPGLMDMPPPPPEAPRNRRDADDDNEDDGRGTWIQM